MSILINPFDLIDVQAGHQSFNNESPEFEKIVREVCRDNVITEAEKAFLIEKGREYFIDESRINQLIQDPFMGKATFKIFIDQICEDGVITSAERTYITEKSRQYNVSSGTLDEMINIGLTRAKLNAQTTESKTMFSLVILYLTATAFHLEETINNLRWLLGQSDGNADNDKLLNDFLTDFSKEFAHEFESQFFNNGKAQNPSRLRIFSEQNEKNEAQQLLHLLNIEQADFKSAKEAYSKNQVSTGSTKTQIPALNWNITIDPSQERMIKIDYRRKEVSFKERRKEELNHFIELLLNERDSHRSREVDLFLQNFEEFYI